MAGPGRGIQKYCTLKVMVQKEPPAGVRLLNRNSGGKSIANASSYSGKFSTDSTAGIEGSVSATKKINGSPVSSVLNSNSFVFASV